MTAEPASDSLFAGRLMRAIMSANDWATKYPMNWRFVWRLVGKIKSSGRMRRRNGRERANSQLVKFLTCPKIMFSQPVDRVMRTSIVPSYGVHSPTHVIVIGNQKGGSGKSTFAMHII